MTTSPPPSRLGPTGGRGTVHGDLSQMASSPRISGVLYYAVLTVAAGIDIATFYQVLALVMRNVPDEVVWLGVVGFTVTALALAHTMGVRARERVDDGKQVLGSASVWLLFVIWLFVGGTAFIVRLTAAPPQVSGGTTIIEEGQVFTNTAPTEDALLAALLFLALYFATGTVAGVAGYLRHNSAAKRYEATMRNRSDVARIAAASAADLALARQTLVALEEERRRREEGWVKAQEEWQAIARRLKQEARLRLASAAQNPSVTDAYFEPPESLRRSARSAAPSTHAHAAPVGGHGHTAAPAVPGSAAAALPAPGGGAAPAPSRDGAGSGPYGSAPAGPAAVGPAAVDPAVVGPSPAPTSSYAAAPQAYPSQAAVPVQVAPWPMNPPTGGHRPADHGADHREVGR